MATTQQFSAMFKHGHIGARVVASAQLRQTQLQGQDEITQIITEYYTKKTANLVRIVRCTHLYCMCCIHDLVLLYNSVADPHHNDLPDAIYFYLLLKTFHGIPGERNLTCILQSIINMVNFRTEPTSESSDPEPYSRVHKHWIQILYQQEYKYCFSFRKNMTAPSSKSG